MVAYCRHEHGRGLSGAGGSGQAAAVGSAPCAERTDLERAHRGPRHDAPGGRPSISPSSRRRTSSSARSAGARSCISSIRFRSTTSPSAGSANSTRRASPRSPSSNASWKKGTAMTDGISRFVYATYIRTTPEKLWAALTKAEFIKQYWFGVNLRPTGRSARRGRWSYPDGLDHRRGRGGRMRSAAPPRAALAA